MKLFQTPQQTWLAGVPYRPLSYSSYGIKQNLNLLQDAHWTTSHKTQKHTLFMLPMYCRKYVKTLSLSKSLPLASSNIPKLWQLIQFWPCRSWTDPTHLLPEGSVLWRNPWIHVQNSRRWNSQDMYWAFQGLRCRISWNPEWLNMTDINGTTILYLLLKQPSKLRLYQPGGGGGGGGEGENVFSNIQMDRHKVCHNVSFRFRNHLQYLQLDYFHPEVSQRIRKWVIFLNYKDAIHISYFVET